MHNVQLLNINHISRNLVAFKMIKLLKFLFCFQVMRFLLNQFIPFLLKTILVL